MSAEPGPPRRELAPVPAAAVERVVSQLTQHFARDELSEEELESRLDRVYASKTLAELESVLSDLRITEASHPPAMTLQPRERVAALMSGQERSLTGLVPPWLEVRARLGYVELDLTHATFGAGTTAIDVRVLMGYVQLRLPPGVRVEHRGRALLGFFSLKGRGSASDDDAAPRVRITGRAMVGFAECVIDVP